MLVWPLPFNSVSMETEGCFLILCCYPSMFSSDIWGLTVELHEQWLAVTQCFHSCLFFCSVKQGKLLKNLMITSRQSKWCHSKEPLMVVLQPDRTVNTRIKLWAVTKRIVSPLGMAKQAKNCSTILTLTWLDADWADACTVYISTIVTLYCIIPKLSLISK